MTAVSPRPHPTPVTKSRSGFLLAKLLLGGSLLIAAVYIFLNTSGTLAGLALLAALAGCLAIAWRWPSLCVVAMAVMTIANLSQNLNANFGLPPISQPVVAGVTLLLVMRQLVYDERPFVSFAAWGALIGYTLLGGASILYAQYWGVAAATSYSVAKDIVLVLVTLAAIRTPRDMRLYLDTVIVTLCAICLLGFYRYLTGSTSNFGGFAAIEFVQRRFAGPITDANFFAMSIAAALPIAVGRILHGPSNGSRLFGAVTGAILLAGLLLTASRGGLVAVLLTMVVFVAIMPPAQRLRAILLIGVAAVVSVVFLSEALMDRLGFLFSPTSVAPTLDVAVEGRLASWAVAWKLFVEHPFLGIGIGNFNPYFQDSALQLGLIFRGEGRSAHSLYFETAAELGLVGVVVLLAIFGAAVIRPFRVAAALDRAGETVLGHDCRALSISLLAIFAARIFLHDDFPVQMWTLVGLALGLGKLVRYQPRITDR